MTTKISVDAHAGWPVAVYAIDRYRGSVKETLIGIVSPGSRGDFYATSTRSLRTVEIDRPDHPASDPAYIPLDFADVVRGLKAGKCYARSGWNGKGMFIFDVGSGTMSHPALGNDAVNATGYFAMKAADGTVVPWLASQTDMRAEDWTEYVPALAAPSVDATGPAG